MSDAPAIGKRLALMPKDVETPTQEFAPDAAFPPPGAVTTVVTHSFGDVAPKPIEEERLPEDPALRSAYVCLVPSLVRAARQRSRRSRCDPRSLSQEVLAQRTRLTQSQISSIENGSRIPSVALLARLLSACNLSEGWRP